MTLAETQASGLYAAAQAKLTAGQNESALDAIARALAIDPNNAAYREFEVSVHYRMGNMPEAIAACQRLLELEPDSRRVWQRFCRLLAENWQFENADAALAQALARFPGDSPLLAIAIFVKQELGVSAEARALAAHAASLHPESMQFGLDAALALPMIHADMMALEQRRNDYSAALEDARKRSLPRWMSDPAQVFKLERSNFLLAYQGGDDRPLQKNYAELIGLMVEAADPSLRAPIVHRFDGSRKLRVGFVSKWIYSSTVGNYFERWVTRLDPLRFDRHVYYTGQTCDALTSRVESGCDRFTRLRGDLRTNARQIRADQLDVLVHLEVGMSTSSYVMATMRLAPVQCAAWGHPVTSGSEMIDYYFSCGAMEPANASRHYTERLVLLDGIGVDLALPALLPALARADLGLPAGGRLYFCPQSLFKIHPEMDELLLGLLAADSDAILVFFQAGSRAVTMAFADRISARIRKAGLGARGQVKFLPRLDGATFRRALCLADVVLDTLHWSGGGTSLDAFAGNVPVVTLPGNYMRGRQTSAMLRMMQLDELVATDTDSYVRKAVEVASDSALNGELRRAIETRKQLIFDRADLSAGFAARLYEVGSRQLADQ